jgi:hypothetical protein
MERKKEIYHPKGSRKEIRKEHWLKYKTVKSLAE